MNRAWYPELKVITPSWKLRVLTVGIVAIAFLLFPFPVPYGFALLAQEFEWEIEGVDCPVQFTEMTDRSLRVDVQNHLHVVYGEDHLYYARFDGTDWHRATVDDSPEVGSHASLVLDASSFPHISYYDERKGDLKYAFEDQSGWHISTLDSLADVGTHTSIGIDLQGFLHISYHDENNQDLKYAFRGTSGWTVIRLDQTDHVGKFSSLATDAAGHPHISCYRGGGELRYVFYDGVRWYFEVIQTGCVIGATATSIALDSMGFPHITCFDSENRRLKYVRKNESGWHVETASDEYSAGYHSSLALDADDSPHISFAGSAWHDLAYAYKDGSAWITRYVDWGRISGHHTSIALDGAGHPHITHADYSDGYDSGLLKHIYIDAAGWHREVVDSEGDVGCRTSVAVDPMGLPHIIYHDVAGGYLKYASKILEGWQNTIVGTEMGIATSSALRLDHLGFPHVVFSSRHGVYPYSYRLKYSYYDGMAWHTEQLTSISGSSGRASLALDTDDQPHVSFTRYEEVEEYVFLGELRYAFFDDDGWAFETVDDAWNAGYNSTLAIDAAGIIHIVYGDWENERLKYAYKDQTGWSVEDVEMLGAMPSMKVDADGHLHVSYREYGSRDLWYAKKDENGWQCEWLDTSVSWTWNSLSLDSSGHPHIAFYHLQDEELKYAYRDSCGWQVQTVDDLGGAGGWPSLAVDDTGVPHISYYDATCYDLKYARGLGLESPRYELPITPIMLALDGPNPCMGYARLMLHLQQEEYVTSSLFDLTGRRVRVVVNDLLPQGEHRLIWDGLDDRGHRVPSGTYIISAEAGGQRVSKRIVLIR